MKWTKVRLEIKEEAEDIVICALADAGIQGVEIEDKAPLTESEKQQMFVDIPPEAAEDDGVAVLNFYLDPATEDIPAVLADVRRELEALRATCDIGGAVLTQEETADIDWASEWKKYFQPFWIDDIHVVPSWWEEEAEDSENRTDAFLSEEDLNGNGGACGAGTAQTASSDDRMSSDRMFSEEEDLQPREAALVLRMDPGTAFGTGMHETTQLCIRQMRRHMKRGDRVLDVGTGSGILGILALKFGADSVLGTDLDPCAEGAVKDNCRANRVREKDFSLILGNLIDDPAVQAAVGENRYEIVFSNILADVLTALAPAASRAVAPGGVWITSGILEGKEQMVREAGEAAGLVLEEITQQGEWMSVTMRKPV